MKIKKNTFTTLVLELFFQSIANCRKLKIQKTKNRLPLLYSLQVSNNRQENTTKLQGILLGMRKLKTKLSKEI
jgi:isochorismate hydrolase